jgi:hypothetical protein
MMKTNLFFQHRFMMFSSNSPLFHVKNPYRWLDIRSFPFPCIVPISSHRSYRICQCLGVSGFDKNPAS